MPVPALSSNGKIGVIAPASPVSAERRTAAIARLIQYGFRIECGDSVSAAHGYLAGDDTVRVADLHTMFARADIDAIFCLRGGYGTMRILEQLDYSLIAHHPKPFVGYSDITALHLAIFQRTGMTTFHGPMVSEIRRMDNDIGWERLFRLLRGEENYPIYDADQHFLCIRDGHATGRLIGGNLTLIATTMGTPFEIDTTGAILLLEDVDEPPYAIDRYLTQLELAGKLQCTAGIIFASCHRCEATSQRFTSPLLDVLIDRLAPLGIPVFFGLPIGHCRPNHPLPLGCLAIMDASKGQLQIIEPAVCLL